MDIAPSRPAILCRADLVRAMAADLTRYDAFRDPDDAFRSLYAVRDAHGVQRYSAFQIGTCLEDAIAVAFQDVVAREMAGS